ncbi:hypothetical protein JOF48_000218 [Arthrobacter stackebrandtii]|uniref:Right-handed parallel beta-helix repeat-containing protein n=1 Tax=Arthrobacter stackebrandtii TaxID=272161 RepID=A0ABS4YRN8_9MICC|nr:glycosyl hydrolase family 28-related protein [Arthrobacter stackebrandtii]MBP2411419.1 hypothetical protein [Arthrobacter stackebrandtii]PYH00296.1 alpha-1,3-galactosidase [Arthrobacter stackebrandtii]
MGTTTNATSATTPWSGHAPLSAAQLGPDTVGFYSGVPSRQDPAALPVHAAERTVVDVTSFGADPTGARDSAAAVHAAVVHARGLGGPATIVFPRGRYTLYPESMPKRELYVSNTVGRFPEFKVKNIAVLLEDMHDVIVDGMGSTLIFHGRATQWAVIRSTDVTIQNLSTDWHAPLVLDLTVLATGVADVRGYRDLKLPAGTTATIHGATATFHGESSPATGEPYWSHGPEVADEWQNQVRDLASGLTLRSPLPLWEGSSAVADLGNNVIRISYGSPQDPGGAGSVYELRQRPRDTPGGFIWESERVELKNLALHYLHGFGIVGQLSKDISLDRITLRAKAGSWRQTAGLADFVQLSGVGGKAQITNCLFDNPHDDPINIHGTYVQVEHIDRASRTVTLKYMEQDTAGFPQFYPGDQLRFVRRATMLSDGAEDYRVTAVEGPNGRDGSRDLERMRVTVDRELPEGLAADAFVAENLTYTPEVYIAGNTFKSTPTRGILVTTPRPVLIERNHFDQMGMASIYISADADYWYESSGVTNATIRNNVFDRPARGWAAIWFDPTNTESEPVRTVHSNISIDANRFRLVPGGSVLRGASVAELSFTNNEVGRWAPFAGEAPAEPQELFEFSASHGITLSGNSYAPGFNVCATVDGMPAAEVNGSDDGVTTRVLAEAPSRGGRPAEAAGRPDCVSAAGSGVGAGGGFATWAGGADAAGRPAALLEPRWTGVEFGAPGSTQAWLAHVPAGTGQVTATLQAAAPDTALFVNYNDAGLVPEADGTCTLILADGPNILEVRTLDRSTGTGTAGQTYRWAIIRH